MTTPVSHELAARVGLEGPDLTEKDLAELEGVSVRTLQKWRQRGCGPRFRKVGTLVRYPVAWIREWRESTGRSGTNEGLRRRP